MQITGKKEKVSLYFHIPFCKKKCPFCHFFVVESREKQHSSFQEALKIEVEQILPLLEGKEILSIYFGGGTPSQLPPIFYQEVLSWFSFNKEIEVTLEANPEDVTLASFQDYLSLGINRVSLGIQSFDDHLLQKIKRGHSSQIAKEAILLTHRAGFSNISIDLLYDLPNQTLASFQKSLEELTHLPITHLSLYNLVLEEGSAFFRQKQNILPSLPSEESSLQMYHLALSTLHHLGFERYEISAFAKGGAHSCHNKGYWEGRSFLGLGPSAFSYWEKKRYRNVANLNLYTDRLKKNISPIDFIDDLPFEERQKELFAIQLRLLSGVDIELFTKNHGSLSLSIQESLLRLEKRGWVEKQLPYYRLTEEGRLFYDSVGVEII